jgi:hypothetical protein
MTTEKKKIDPANSNSLNSALLARLPQLRDRYIELKRWWGPEEPGPHVVFEDVLVPYLVERLNEASEDESVTRVFDFLEELLASGDQSARNVVGASVLEGLYEDVKSRMRTKALMRPKTRNLAAKVGRDWAVD